MKLRVQLCRADCDFAAERPPSVFTKSLMWLLRQPERLPAATPSQIAAAKRSTSAQLATEEGTPKRKAQKKVSCSPLKRQQKKEQERRLSNERGALCRCGRVDEEKFMLACDGCDRWFHGGHTLTTEQSPHAYLFTQHAIWPGPGPHPNPRRGPAHAHTQSHAPNPVRLYV